MAAAPKPSLVKLFRWQAIGVVALALAFSILGSVAFYSALLGGVVAAVPAAIFARHAFRYTGANQAQLTLRAFYWGETLKLVFCAVGFALVFKYSTQLNLAAFWISCIINLFVPVVVACLGVLDPRRGAVSSEN